MTPQTDRKPTTDVRGRLPRDLFWVLGIFVLGLTIVGVALSWKSTLGRYWLYRLNQGDLSAEKKLGKLLPDVTHLLVRTIEERQPLLSDAEFKALSARPQAVTTVALGPSQGPGRDDPAYLAAARLLAVAGPDGERALLRRLDHLMDSGRNVDNMLPALRFFKDRRAQQLCSRAWVEGRMTCSYDSQLMNFSGMESALFYLSCRQEANGRWSAARWGARGASDIEVTSLATMAFLGAGYTPRYGKYRNNVYRALSWLAAQQQPGGRVGSGAFKDHVLGGLALCDAFGMTRNAFWKPRAEQALAFTLGSQLPGGGWSGEAQGKPDLCLTAACVLQLRSAKYAGLAVPARAFQCAARISEQGLRTSVKQAHAGTADATCLRKLAASAIACTAMGLDRRQLPLIEASDALWKQRSNVLRSPMLTLYARQLAFTLGGKQWMQHYRFTREKLVTRRPDRVNPRGPWPYRSEEVNRLGDVGTTAVRAITLGIYYRGYIPLYPLTLR